MRINSVIATLGTLYIGRGLANIVAGGSPVTGVPIQFNNHATSSVGPIPVPVLIFALIAVTMIVVERKTLLGRWAIASGGDQEGARLSRVSVNPVRTIFFFFFPFSCRPTRMCIHHPTPTCDPD